MNTKKKFVLLPDNYNKKFSVGSMVSAKQAIGLDSQKELGLCIISNWFSLIIPKTKLMAYARVYQTNNAKYTYISELELETFFDLVEEK